MKFPIPWIVAAVAIVAAGYATVSNHADRGESTSDRPAPQAAQGAATRADVDALRREVALLKSALADNRSARAPSDATVARAATPSAMQVYNARSDHPADALSQAEQEQRLQDHITEVATGFEGETRDQRWANDAGIALESALASQELKALSVQSIDCRTKTCRVEVEDDGSAAASGALPQLALQMAGTLPNIVSQRIERQNGRATVVLYMSRE
jgi:hypothetical protein